MWSAYGVCLDFGQLPGQFVVWLQIQNKYWAFSATASFTSLYFWQSKAPFAYCKTNVQCYNLLFTVASLVLTLFLYVDRDQCLFRHARPKILLSQNSISSPSLIIVTSDVITDRIILKIIEDLYNLSLWQMMCAVCFVGFVMYLVMLLCFQFGSQMITAEHISIAVWLHRMLSVLSSCAQACFILQLLWCPLWQLVFYPDQYMRQQHLACQSEVWSVPVFTAAVTQSKANLRSVLSPLPLLLSLNSSRVVVLIMGQKALGYR